MRGGRGWSRICQTGRRAAVGAGFEHRPVIDGILWRTRTGSPWRDVPACYGDYRILHGRHRRWSAGGTWAAILAALQTDSDADAGEGWAVAIDSTVVRAHRHAAGARHALPKDVPTEQLAPLLPEPATAESARPTGGWVE
jgi:transposase